MIRLTNSTQRDATVAMSGVRLPPGVTTATATGPAMFRRWLTTTEDGQHERLAEDYGDDYAQALIDGDPETDIEQVGRLVGATDTVYLTADCEVMHRPPQIVEIVRGPDGSERERRAPVDTAANIDGDVPVRWTGRKVPKGSAVRRYAFTRTIQLRHVDGLTYDYLHAMATELATEGVLMLVGAGPGGKAPLVIRANGTPYRGFLEGRVDGPRYQLLLRLSNTELRRPTTTTTTER